MAKKKKKKPAMTKKVKSPTKQQRRKMGRSSSDYLQPGADGRMIGTNK